ncbi:MAG: TolB family protein [Muribaculaceae bacterium]
MNLRKLLTVSAAALALGAWAAAPIPLSVEAGAHHPVLSPDGATVLYSTVDHQGLKALDRSTGRVTVIDEAASAGFAPVFSTDGRTVIYRTATTVDGLLYRDVRSFSLTDERHSQLAQPSRNTLDLNTFANKPTYAVATYRTIRVVRNGAAQELSPLADAHSYLWASLSPDGQQLAFVEPFSGVYVANADGTDARCVLPKGDYVSWAGEHTLVAVVSHDDGYVVTDSRLVSVNIATGITTDLTDASMMVGEASAAPCGVVVFSDLNGQMYILNLND